MIVEQFEIPSELELLIQDNVVNPENNLVVRALEKLTVGYRADTLARARLAYKQAQDRSNLPDYEDPDAMIAWHVTQPSYQDATARWKVQELSRLNDELLSVQKHMERATQQVVVMAMQEYEAAVAAEEPDQPDPSDGVALINWFHSREPITEEGQALKSELDDLQSQYEDLQQQIDQLNE